MHRYLNIPARQMQLNNTVHTRRPQQYHRQDVLHHDSVSSLRAAIPAHPQRHHAAHACRFHMHVHELL